MHLDLPSHGTHCVACNENRFIPLVLSNASPLPWFILQTVNLGDETVILTWLVSWLIKVFVKDRRQGMCKISPCWFQCFWPRVEIWPWLSRALHVTGPLWRESNCYRWIPLTKASYTEPWCFLRYAPEHTVKQTIESSMIWHAIALIWPSPWWYSHVTQLFVMESKV